MDAPVVKLEELDARETPTRVAAGIVRAVFAGVSTGRVLRKPGRRAAGEPDLGADILPALRRAVRQRQDVRVDASLLALLLQCLSRIDALERQVRTLQAHPPGHPPAPPRDGPQPWREPHG